jgi:hypothetical protein
MNKEKEYSEDFGLNIHYHKEDESTDNIEDIPEDIPYSENWKRISLDKMKKDFNNWLDDSIEQEFVKDPEFYLSDDVNEKRFYMRVINRGPFEEEDEDLEYKEYTCIFVPYDTKRVEMT